LNILNLKIKSLFITRARNYVQLHVFLGLLIIDFISYVHESPHDEIDGGVLFCMYLNILDEMHLIAQYIE